MLMLHKATVGSVVKVENLASTGILRERMLALGLTKGAKVEVIRRGPCGDPTVFNIRGAMIALRNEEASLVTIQ